MFRLFALIALTPGLAFAEAFQPPIPEVQSATAELWYVLASLSFVLALAGAHFLVRRR
jgi:hypothetical protein